MTLKSVPRRSASGPELRITRGSVTSPLGYRACGVRCGIKTCGKDLALLASDVPAVFSAMFTTSRIAAAPVLFSRRVARSGEAQALIVNSGNANACTGERGIQDAGEMARLTADALRLKPGRVAVASTGIIGVALPMDLVRKGIIEAGGKLSRRGGRHAAMAIMTTDTHPKHFAAEFTLSGKACCIGAMAKGSGMIHPDLATMIVVFSTDVSIEKKYLDEALNECVRETFNSLTVDGEKSTNDSVFLFANGKGGNPQIRSKGSAYEKFLSALKSVSLAVTKELARDGEGATKLITVRVGQAKNREQAVAAAKSIANSMLVKTAIFGRDPNWGRIASAVGASCAVFHPDNMIIHLGDIRVFEKGMGIDFDKKRVNRLLEKDEITISVDLGAGKAGTTVYTCDLTYDYIKINAEYHT